MSLKTRALCAFTVICVLGISRSASAHCDTLDGPVVGAGRTAIEKSDLTPALRWIQAGDESELRAAFDRALKVREQSDQARELADLYFLETLVRLHRAGENAPYTGLKPAGTTDPAIAAADNAIASGSADAVVEMITDAVAAGVEKRLHDVLETAKHADHNVEAGRKHVAAYVRYVHYVEGLTTAAGASHGHEPAESAEHSH